MRVKRSGWHYTSIKCVGQSISQPSESTCTAKRRDELSNGGRESGVDGDGLFDDYTMLLILLWELFASDQNNLGLENAYGVLIPFLPLLL